MNKLVVDLAERSYPIYIGSGLMTDPELFKSFIRYRNVIVVSNTTVAPLYMAKLRSSLDSFCNVFECILPDGEEYKTLDSFNRILTEMLRKGMGRDSTVIALGGGVVGDISGFAASAYQRGVDFVQVPTTLLAQVDSSVGGKTGVNHELGKNMIGAFYQPRGVVIDTECLHTLPSREISAGMAEVIKYGIIWDSGLFEQLEKNMSDLLALDDSKLSSVIARCCSIKADVVHNDEKEGGIRAILNLGHTFGHAIENHVGYGVWLHGEAVAAGIVLASYLSFKRGYIDRSYYERIRKLLSDAGLPVSSPQGMNADDYIELMRHDKKVKSGTIRYVLPNEGGRSSIYSDVSDDEVKKIIENIDHE